MKRRSWLVLPLAVLLLAGCEVNLSQEKAQAVTEATGTVRLSIIDGTNTRTVLPSSFLAADSYEATLTSKEDEERSYKARSTRASLEFEDVRVGDYTLSVTGTLNGQTVSTGNTEITVYANTENTAAVQLEAVTGEGTGSVSVTLNWEDAVKSEGYFKDMYESGPLTIEFYKRVSSEDGESYEDTLLTDPQTAPDRAVSYTFTADDIPVSKGFIGFFRIKSGEEVVMELGFVDFQIYAGQTSVVDSNDSDTFTVTQANAPAYASYVNVSGTYGEEDPEHSVTVSVTAKGSRGNQLYSTLNITLYDSVTSVSAGTAEISGEVTGTDTTVGCTFTGLVSGRKYRAEVYGTTKRGKITEVSKINIVTKTLVTGITVDGTVPENAVEYNDRMTFTASVTPDNATVSSVEWSVSDSETLSLSQINNSAIIYAKKPGKATISVESTDAMKDGTKASKTLGEVTVNLSTPSVAVTTEKDSETAQSFISLQWNEVAYADSYEIYRSVNGADAELLTTVVSTSYDDRDITAGWSYSYSVKATSTEYTDYSSALSVSSEEYTPSTPTITLVQPTIENLTLQIVSGTDPAPADITVTPDSPVTLAIPAEIDGATTNWYVNGQLVKADSTSVELTYDMKQVDGYDADANALTLEAVTADGTKYSKTIYFRVVSVLDTGVQEFTLGEYTPVGTTGLSIKTTVLPTDATIRTLSYSSSDESVATVDSEGNVTILKNGTVTFTVRSSSGAETKKTTTVYTPITESTIMNLVTNYLKTNITAANSSFDGDWWPGETASKYNANGVSISSPEDASQKAGTLSISETTLTSSDMGSIKVKTSSGLSLWASDGGGTWKKGYLGTDPLQYVAYKGVGVISVTLPYGQGTASISFPSQLDVINKSGTYRIEMTGRSAVTYSYSSYPLM